MQFPCPSPPQWRRKSQSSIFLPSTLLNPAWGACSSGQGKPWQPRQLSLSKSIAFNIRDWEGFGKFRRRGGFLMEEAEGCSASPLSSRHPFLSQSFCWHFSLMSSGPCKETDRTRLGSFSWGWACRHRDGVRYMVEHQHWLDMGNHKVQPGQGKPWRAQTSPGKGSSGARSHHGLSQMSKEPARAGRKS